jgi:SMC interacting uncharacterized protein involved in chromosome segregation
MPSWFNRVSSDKGLKHIGDPGKIIEYMHGLEAELKDANEAIDSLSAQIDALKNVVNNKTAEIQHLEAVNRSKW